MRHHPTPGADRAKRGRFLKVRLLSAALLLPILMTTGSIPVIAAPGQAAVPAKRVDVNRASAAELESLPGIGPALAGRIIARREEKGPFSSVAELLEIKGIGPRLLKKLDGRITAGETHGSSPGGGRSPRPGHKK